MTAPAKRGDRSLVVTDTAPFLVGREYELRMRDASDKSVTLYLYAGDPGPISNLKGTRQSFVFRVMKLDQTAKRVYFERPLRTEARAAWQPELYAAQSTVENSGIEGLAFVFPNTPL